MKYFVVILGVFALLAITQAQDNSLVAESSDGPSGPKTDHFDNGLNPAQPIEGEKQHEDNENSDENPPERVPVWHAGISFSSG